MGKPKGQQHDDSADDNSDSPLSTPRRGFMDAALADIADALERELGGDESDNWMYGGEDGFKPR